jgi:hypothetical protein
VLTRRQGAAGGRGGAGPPDGDHNLPGQVDHTPHLQVDQPGPGGRAHLHRLELLAARQNRVRRRAALIRLVRR